jgi:hypothetical protein
MKSLVVFLAILLTGCAHRNDAILLNNLINNTTYENVKYEIYLKMYNATQKN